MSQTTGLIPWKSVMITKFPVYIIWDEQPDWSRIRLSNIPGPEKVPAKEHYTQERTYTAHNDICQAHKRIPSAQEWCTR